MFGLLHFGDGPQAINYFILCLVALLGTLQFVAIRYRRRDLIWLDGQPGIFLSMLLIAGSFIWFFVTDQEIFIPGLAGGELFTLFAIALILAAPITRVVAFALARVSVQDTSRLGNLLRRNASRKKDPTL